MKNKLMIIIPVLTWLIIGIYGIYYNITYIDEAKYLIKGWLMTTGQVGYYSTPEFFYQHMPGIFLWYGLGQTFFGPSLLLARIQSFFVGLGVLWITYRLAGKKVLPLLALAPVAILYYSAAVPQSIIALVLLMAFYCLVKNRYRLATLAFSLSFIIRENFLFTLIIYWLWLMVIYRKNLKELLINYLISLTILAIFFLPGWPGTINILKNFPGVSRLLPVNAAEKTVLGLNRFVDFGLKQYWQAIKEFGGLFFSFGLVGILALLRAVKAGKIWPKDSRWRLLIVVTATNFVAHVWSAANLSPRAVIAYFAYSFPLIAIIFTRWLGNKKIKYYPFLLVLSLIGLPFASLFQLPDRPNTISELDRSARALRPLVADKQKIVWLAEPISLYLAGKVSYYPLINHTNFYKSSNDTPTVRKLGFWNQEMMAEWLNEADLVVLDYNRLKIVSDNNLTQIIENKVNNNYTFIQTPENIWPGNLSFFSPL